MSFQKSSSLCRDDEIPCGSFQRVHGSTDNPKTLVILKLPGSENGDEDGDDDRYQPRRRVMTDDAFFDGNDFLRLQDLGGGVFCFYYTDLKL
jgi:hypothetical protein